MKLTARAALVAGLVVCSVPTLVPAVSAVENARIVQTVTGNASWYGGRFHGRRTANGETYDMHAMTAAHRSLPFGTRVLVTNPANSQSVLVRINDRGPFVGNRVIDLSRGAANSIGVINAGVAPVRIDVLD